MAKKVVYELSGVAYNVAPNSAYEIQKAPLGKRAIAFLIDLVLMIILTIGFIRYIASPVADQYFGYQDLIDRGNEKIVNFGFARIVEGEVVNIDFSLESEATTLDNLIQTHGADLVEEGLATFNETTQKYTIGGEVADQVENLEKLFNMDDEVYQIARAISFAKFMKTTISALLAQLLIFLLFPLIFHNGQTLGKKIFNLGLVNKNGLKVSTLRVVIRFILGLFLIETAVTIALYSVSELFGIIILLLTIGLAFLTNQNRALHDYIGGTVVVDLNAQYIIDTMSEKVAAQREEYKKYLAEQKNKKNI